MKNFYLSKHPNGTWLLTTIEEYLCYHSFILADGQTLDCLTTTDYMPNKNIIELNDVVFSSEKPKDRQLCLIKQEGNHIIGFIQDDWIYFPLERTTDLDDYLTFKTEDEFYDYDYIDMGYFDFPNLKVNTNTQYFILPN